MPAKNNLTYEELLTLAAFSKLKLSEFSKKINVSPSFLPHVKAVIAKNNEESAATAKKLITDRLNSEAIKVVDELISSPEYWRAIDTFSSNYFHKELPNNFEVIIKESKTARAVINDMSIEQFLNLFTAFMSLANIKFGITNEQASKVNYAKLPYLIKAYIILLELEIDVSVFMNNPCDYPKLNDYLNVNQVYLNDFSDFAKTKIAQRIKEQKEWNYTELARLIKDQNIDVDVLNSLIESNKDQ